MAGILGDDGNGLLGSASYGSETNFSSQLGRISGKLLTDNLQRNGIDLAFNNDLLYLKVSPIVIGSEQDGEDGDPNYDSTLPSTLSGTGIGINRDVPIYELDVNADIKTTELTITDIAYLDNLKFIAPNTLSTTTGRINVYTNASGPLFHDRLITYNLALDNNLISSFSNSNIVLAPNGTGTVELTKDTYITGNLEVGTSLLPKNIRVLGDLSTQSRLILGDQIGDTITVNTDFTQSIIPGDDIAYDLGKSNKRWAELNSPDWTNITTGAWPGSGLRPQAMIVSNQMRLDGVNNTISGIQSNEDILIRPDTGITYIEQTKWQDNDITNLSNTALTLANTGIGYTLFAGTNGVVIPAGPTSDRRANPELGETRWNTTVPSDQYLESWDGSVWVLSTGGGEIVTQRLMEDLGFVYSAILG